MNRFTALSALTILCLVFAVSAFSQTQPAITVTKLTDKIYEMSTGYYGAGVNWIASVGDDGILLVDAGPKENSAELANLVKTLGNGQVKVIINTHAHIEHTGGNTAFGKDVIKIAHKSVRDRLQNGAYLLQELPEEVLPTLTFTDSLTLYFNGEEIRLYAIPGAHDDGDIIVHFTKSKVVSAGALCSGMHLPTADYIGGNVLKFPEAVQRLINSVPDDVTLVPGHGRNCTMVEEKEYQKVLTETIDIVKTGLAAGKDVAALQRDSVLKPWVSYAGQFSTLDYWVQTVANASNNVKPGKPIVTDLYYAYKAKDVDSSIAVWTALKQSNPNDYNFGEGQLVGFGYYLLGKGKVKEAIKLFDLYVKEFPAAWNAYDCLAEAHLKDGNKALAKKLYKKSLKLNPANTNATDVLKTL
jgi:cyclase